MKKLEEQKQDNRGGHTEKEEHSYQKHKPCNIFVNS